MAGSDDESFDIPQEMMPTAEEFAVADRNVTMMVLSQGTTDDGRDYWAYLAIPPSRMLPFKIAEQQGAINLEDFGEIVEFGFDKEPPEDIKARMEEQYELNHDLEKELREGLELAIKTEEKIEKQSLVEKYAGKKAAEERDNSSDE